jgi:hypothetical protein
VAFEIVVVDSAGWGDVTPAASGGEDIIQGQTSNDWRVPNVGRGGNRELRT